MSLYLQGDEPIVEDVKVDEVDEDEDEDDDEDDEGDKDDGTPGACSSFTFHPNIVPLRFFGICIIVFCFTVIMLMENPLGLYNSEAVLSSLSYYYYYYY